MQYLSVKTSGPTLAALEEINEELTTEITESPLVDVDDVSEALAEELDALGGLRKEIEIRGIDRKGAQELDVAIEGFLDRHSLSLFTRERSVDGVYWALEEIDNKRQGKIQALLKWLTDRLNDFVQFITKLFGRGGRAENTMEAAKEAAQAASTERKPNKMADVMRDPTAASQEARIDPAGEKSGSYEDFCDRFSKYIEPLQGEYNRINEEIGNNKILSIALASPDSVDAFFTHMEKLSDVTSAIRSVVDNSARLVRSSKEPQQTAEDINKQRLEIYRVLGGSDTTVFETLGQQVFTDSNAKEYEALDYDKLVPLMVKITKNIPAANAQTRINELNQLTKAVAEFSKIVENNSFKSLDATHRNVLLAAMQGLANDVSRYVTILQKDWSLTLQIHAAVSQFWQKELGFYYKMIGAIQKAATETFEEDDRKALYDNFKQLGFAMDLSPEDLKRRGVGNESFVDSVPKGKPIVAQSSQAIAPDSSYSGYSLLAGLAG